MMQHQRMSIRCEKLITGGPAQWPQVLETRIIPGNGRPYAVDTIELPYDNPWKVPMFCGDHDFLPDGSALVCTMQGDVWHVTGLDSGTDKPVWPIGVDLPQGCIMPWGWWLPTARSTCNVETS